MPDYRRELASPAWNQYLFNWEQSSSVVWALVIVFGTALVGPLVIFALARVFHVQDLFWFRTVFGAGFMTAFSFVVFSTRRTILLGSAFFGGRMADEVFRRVVADDWRALAVAIVVAVFGSIMLVQVFRSIDASRCRAAKA